MVFPVSSIEDEYLLRSKLPEEFEIQQADSREPVGALGNRPIAISQSSAFITGNSMDVGEYLQAFESDVSEAQDLLSPDLVGDKRAVGDEQREDFYLEYLEAIVGSNHVTTATRRPNPGPDPILNHNQQRSQSSTINQASGTRKSEGYEL